MQKVRFEHTNVIKTAYKTTVSYFFPSRYIYAIAYILYLVFEEGSPFVQTDFFHFNLRLL